MAKKLLSRATALFLLPYHRPLQEDLLSQTGLLDLNDIKPWDADCRRKRLKSSGPIYEIEGMPGDAYPDSSFLVSLMCADANHQKAVRYMARVVATLTFTPLHRIEVRNALRRACALKQITDQELRLSLQQVEGDLRAGLLVHTPVEWTNVFRRADDLSTQHAHTNPQRTIDLLHVAIAIESGSQNFLSFDKRQRLLARAAGLRTNP